MKLFKITTLAAIMTTLTLGATVAQAGDIEIRKFSPNIEISKDYRLNKNTYTNIDNSKRSWNSRDMRYSYDRDYLNARQTYNQKRRYSANVGQGASNNVGDIGHQMNQGQGGTYVSTSSADSRTHSQGGFNLASPSASSHNGDTSSGNYMLYGSQIGGNQSGFQGGNNTNLQSNDQNQRAQAWTGSRDYLNNGNSNN